MASSAADAASTAPWRLQIGRTHLRAARVGDAVERWLEAERDQLVLWLPVALGAGITGWFLLPDATAWRAAMLLLAALAIAPVAVGRGGRTGRVVSLAAAASFAGMALIWARAIYVATPALVGPAVGTLEARVERVEPLPPRQLVRLRLAPLRWAPTTKERAPPERKPVTLPTHLRVNVRDADVPPGLSTGAVIRLGARLMPPPEAAVPGAYNYAQTAWFDGIGATGRGFAPVSMLTTALSGDPGLRARLSRHIQASAPGGAGAIAAALATGDQGAIPLDDANAMRRSGLAHLLSVSGLHITAVVAATMFLVMRLLAVSPSLALRVRLPLVAGGAGALAAIGYTLLTGAEVPTIRSCVAALLVLTALAMGREAMTLRLVAAGAVVVLLLYPESLAGPSFQLSFAAVAAIVALHEHPRVKAWFQKRDEPRWRKTGRELGSLLLTGFVVEVALMPISVFHFHRAGVYGAVANIVAIPLTTFVTMPLEALALLLDPVGWGGPAWWLTARSLDLLLWIAHSTATLPGSVAAIPSTPAPAFALMVAGGLWIGLWRTKWRRLGALPLIVGVGWALTTSAPDLLVTGDGKHVGIRTSDGGLALLRDRTGDYTADMLAENGGIDDLPVLLSDQRDARCSRDLCLVDRQAGGRRWRILATRSSYLVPADQMAAACRGADIVISERRLPRGCTPHWLRLDAPVLAQTGGVAITLATGAVRTVREPGDGHPWAIRLNRSGGADRRAYPARGPGRGRNAADHRHDWQGRGAPSPLRGGNI